MLQRLARKFNPGEWLIIAVSLMLLVSSLGQISGAQKPQSQPQQSIALSDTQTAPDSQPAATTTPISPPSSRPIAITPWQGPIDPMRLPQTPLPPVIDKLSINEPVVFLGIDDGWYQSPENQAWLKDHHLPFTLFLVDSQIKDNYDYFGQLQDAGMTIEDHSVTHPDLIKLKLPDQQGQICNAANTYSTVFGRRPEFFRPPYGDYNGLTQQAAANCSIKALINWHVTLENGAIHFQAPATHLEPGDIILAHFQTDLIPNMQALSDQLQQDHLQIGRLEDWLH